MTGGNQGGGKSTGGEGANVQLGSGASTSGRTNSCHRSLRKFPSTVNDPPFIALHWISSTFFRFLVRPASTPLSSRLRFFVDGREISGIFRRRSYRSNITVSFSFSTPPARCNAACFDGAGERSRETISGGCFWEKDGPVNVESPIPTRLDSAGNRLL